jgi:hypothetical protein
MTVNQLRSSMTVREFSDWVAWFTLRQQRQEHAEAAAAPPGSGVGMTLDLTTDAGVSQLATMFKKG